MPIDRSKVVFQSNDNIDRLVATDTVDVTLGGYDSTATVVDLTSYGFSRAPKVIANLSFDSGVTWYNSGENFKVIESSTTSIRLHNYDFAGGGVKVRYWVFSSGILED